jgi:hypothetical protein
MSNPAMLKVLEDQHRGTPAGKCVAARLAQLAMAAPSTPKVQPDKMPDANKPPDASKADVQDDAAWKAAEASKAVGQVREYLIVWRSGRHITKAQKLLEQLCSAQWQQTRNSANWVKLTLFVDGACQGMSFANEALRRRDEVDSKLWKTAKQSKGKEGYEAYLIATHIPCGRAGESLIDCGGSFGACTSEARYQISDFDTWAKASRPDATCDEVGDYIEKHPVGRFVRPAIAKLRLMLDRDKTVGLFTGIYGHCGRYAHFTRPDALIVGPADFLTPEKCR